jgi:phosphatidylserine/phosphatidylglycerophosphate/cardiolipin synthase-like enzyme
MKLLIQPGDSIMPLVNGINSATKSVEIVIFRFDRSEIERALANAVKRGVFVHALIAHKNRAGEDNLRKLEMRLLADGVTVVRSADDLTRYHGKLMIVDRRELHLFSFNLTYIDIERSRSFAIITDNQKVVQEAVKLFEADAKRQPYDAGLPAFVVSPANARRQLSEFIKEAKTELLIYDPKVSDPAMIRLLEERAKEGVEIKIIGRLTRRAAGLAVRKLAQMRLHTRTMIRDGTDAFVGSQSLRELELDARREVGLIFNDKPAVRALAKTFQEDWLKAEQYNAEKEDAKPAAKVARKLAKVVAKELPPVSPALAEIIKEVAGEQAEVDLTPTELEESIKDAVMVAVQEVVRDVVEDMVEQRAEDKAPA